MALQRTTPTTREPSPPPARQDDPRALSHALIDRLGWLNQLLQGAVAGSGVSLSQARALATLVDLGPQRVTALAHHQQVRQPTMTALVAGLERRGWIARQPDPADRRAVLVSVTPAGRATLRRLRTAYVDMLAAHVQRLSGPERAALDRSVDALSTLVERLKPS